MDHFEYHIFQLVRGVRNASVQQEVFSKSKWTTAIQQEAPHH